MAAWLVYASRQGSDFGAMHVIYQFTEQYPFYMRLVIAGRRRRWGLDDVEPAAVLMRSRGPRSGLERVRLRPLTRP